MPAPPIIRDLVEHFERNRESYLAAGYNETQLRREFLDPCFKALGWDIDNEQRLAEAYKDVIHEDAIKVGVATKAPDYCFRIGGRRIYFLEAKKPAVKVRDDSLPAFQLRRYAWSSKLPLSVLSNFEWLAVYDCRIKPDQRDKASVAPGRRVSVPTRLAPRLVPGRRRQSARQGNLPGPGRPVATVDRREEADSLEQHPRRRHRQPGRRSH